MGTVHIAVTRKVKPGCEREFEEALREFARESLREPGTTGVHLIAPAPGTTGGEYGILRSFDSESSCGDFYASAVFKKWESDSASMVSGPPVRRKLHGLEAFFREPARQPPPRWKMAVVTWLGVFPSVLLWSTLLPPLLGPLGRVLTTALVTLCVVITLAWGVMPVLTKVFGKFLRGESN